MKCMCACIKLPDYMVHMYIHASYTSSCSYIQYSNVKLTQSEWVGGKSREEFEAFSGLKDHPVCS